VNASNSDDEHVVSTSMLSNSRRKNLVEYTSETFSVTHLERYTEIRVSGDYFWSV
jgi:hypothetical protein